MQTTFHHDPSHLLLSQASVSSPVSISSSGLPSHPDNAEVPSTPLNVSHAIAAILPFLLTFSVTTTPVVIVDPSQSLRSSGAVSIWGRIRRRGTRISLAQARLLAFKLLAETDARIQNEREAEQRLFFASEDYETP